MIIEDIKALILKRLNVTEEYYLENTKLCVRQLLTLISSNNRKADRLRNQSRKCQEDAEQLERYIKGVNYEESGGKNTGLKSNPELIRNYEILKLHEEARIKLIEALLLEKTLEDENDLIIKFIELLEPVKSEILYKRYIERKSFIDIENEMGYAYQSSNIIHNRAIKQLAEKLKSDKKS